MKKYLLVLGLLVAETLSAQPRGPLPGTVVEYPDAHDSVVAFCDGRYYVFTTGMGCMSSDDLQSWRIEEPVFKETPQWAVDKGFR